MADYIRPTPRSPILGLLADALTGGVEWMRDPRRAQQMQGLGSLLAETGIPATVERLSYGEPLTTGRGMTTRLRPEAEAALMTLGPEAVPIGRGAMAAVKATKGLPVGASIRQVAPQEEALRLAQQRAALPVSEGGLGLPPNNTPMDRARAMGFVENVYHGTGRDFPAFEVGQVSKHTAGSQPSTMHWMGKEPLIADSYAMANYFGGTPTVMPLMLRSEQRVVKDMRGKGPRDLPLWSTDTFAEKLFKRNKNADVVELQNFNDPGIPGYVGYGTHLAVKDPSQLRSRFAAFDPTRRNEPDLLAGALPFTALLDEENRALLEEQLGGLLGR